MTTMKTAYLTGDTFMVRDKLAAKGWRWSPERKAYVKTADWADEAEVVQVVRSYPGVRNRPRVLAATLVEVAALRKGG